MSALPSQALAPLPAAPAPAGWQRHDGSGGPNGKVYRVPRTGHLARAALPPLSRAPGDASRRPARGAMAPAQGGPFMIVEGHREAPGWPLTPEPFARWVSQITAPVSGPYAPLRAA